MGSLLQIVFDALALGSLYALAALGIALIFGVMRLVNFAHGDVIAFLQCKRCLSQQKRAGSKGCG